MFIIPILPGWHDENHFEVNVSYKNVSFIDTSEIIMQRPNKIPLNVRFEVKGRFY